MVNNVETDVDIGIKEGDVFTSFSDFLKKLKANCESKYVQYSVMNSRTVNAAKKKVKRYLNPNLTFYSSHWACVHGGRQFKSRGQGIRKTSTLRKQDLCQTGIHVRISPTGNDYIVAQVNNKHSHAVIPQLFKQLPHNRKLPENVKQNVKELLKMKTNKHMLREKLETDLNKHITLKDLRNLAYQTNNSTNNVQSVCNEIQAKFGADCHVLIDSDDVLRGLTFCTKQMIENMSAYPEFICMDATYKLLNIKAPLYLVLNEDGNGESSIVAVGILVQEDKETLEWFLETFKGLINPSWNKITSIMTDKDITERQVLNQCFPDAQFHICIFHVLKIFQREITCDKLKINGTTRDEILRMLQQLIYVSSEEFFSILGKIRDNYPERVYRYLCDNWVDIRNEWCPLLGHKNLNFLNRTNNRLESINAKLKSVISKYSTLEDFIANLFVALNTLEKEKNSRVADMLNKRRPCMYKCGQWQYEYFKYLSPYAFSKLEKQFNFSSIKILNANQSVFIIEDKNNQFETTFENCTCLFFNSMGLPCKHIFLVRDQNSKNLFDSELVINRWKFSYFLDHCQFLHLPVEDSSSFLSDNNTVYINRSEKKYSIPKSSQEKYRQLFCKSKLIATLGADLCGKTYVQLKDILDAIIKCFQDNNFCFKNLPACDSDCNNCSPVGNRIVYEQINNMQCSESSYRDITSETEVINNGQMDIELVTLTSETQIPILSEASENKINKSEKNFNEFAVTQTNGYTNLISESGAYGVFGNTSNNLSFCSNSNLDSDGSVPIKNKQFSPYSDNLEFNEQNILTRVDSDVNSIILRPVSRDRSNHNSAERKSATKNDSKTSSLCENRTNAVTTNHVEELKLDGIKVPKIKTRGRPAGSDLTVIGLSKKRRKLDGPVSFSKKKGREKITTMLKWIVRDVNTVHLKQIEINDLLPIKDVDIRILEVNVTILKKYFTEDAWRFFENVKKRVKEHAVWYCQRCSKIIINEPSVLCECCLNWYHIDCEASCNKTKVFFCIHCRLK